MSSDKGNPSFHVIFRGVSPKIPFFAMAHIWLSGFMNTLPERYESWYTMWKNHADSKYDSQSALRAMPDYEPLMTNNWSIGLFHTQYKWNQTMGGIETTVNN